MRTIAIYTYINEGDPMPAQPYNAEYWKVKGFDFICFVTKKGDLPDFHGVWHIEELPISWGDARLNAVLPKLNPQSVLDYEYSLWIDSRVKITGDSIYEHCKELQSREVMYAGLKHKSIRSVYTYAWKVYKQGLEPFKVVYKAMSFLIGKGILPGGFQDTSVMFRSHEKDEVLEFDRWWWECLLTHGGSHYDMLMHLFAMKDTPSLKCEYLNPAGLEM
ncbi:MAG: DUF616 domain-containing protein [Bacteroidales bacterium]|nr:DUF616 domain-containing protein [Bacteroidales bacterium]